MILIKCLLLGVALNSGGINFQINTKPDLYLYFEVKSEQSYKITRTVSAVMRKDRGVSRPGYEYDIYGYIDSLNKREYRYLYATVDKKKYFVVDSVFFKKNVRIFSEIKDTPGFGYDSTDSRRYPFKRIFIVENLTPGKFKVVQVNSYIGSDY